MVLAVDTHSASEPWMLERLRGMSRPEHEVQAWAAAVNQAGLEACQNLFQGHSQPFCFGDAPSVADIFLVRQLGNARRLGMDLGRFPRLLAEAAACTGIPAFAAATPDRQPDAE